MNIEIIRRRGKVYTPRVHITFSALARRGPPNRWANLVNYIGGYLRRLHLPTRLSLERRTSTGIVMPVGRCVIPGSMVAHLSEDLSGVPSIQRSSDHEASGGHFTLQIKGRGDKHGRPRCIIYGSKTAPYWTFRVQRGVQSVELPTKGLRDATHTFSPLCFLSSRCPLHNISEPLLTSSADACSALRCDIDR